MKTLRWVAPALVLAGLASTGCFITSAQILTHFDLPNPFTINSTANDHSEIVPVDLNTLGDYTDNKDKMKGLTDLAILGTFTNVAGPGGGVEVWISPDLAPAAGGSPNAPPAGAILLWGPAAIGATGDVVKLGWDESAALFTKDGKKMLIDEVKGDGAFTLYTTGTVGTNNILVEDGELVLTLDAGI